MKQQIVSASDTRIAAYQMVRERDLVGREGLFVAEGEVVLSHFVRSPLITPISVLIAEKRVDSLSGILQQLADDVPVYIASQEVMDGIVGFPIHRGILALGQRRETPSASDLLGRMPASCLVLALIGVCNHDNMGGIFRNAAAFGVDAIIADASSCDPFYRKSIRVSVGAVLGVPFARLNTEEDMVALFSRFKIDSFALSPRGKLSISQVKRPPRTAIILGSEGPGLPSDVLAACQTVSIPMAAGFDSLNVATTSGIVLHQFALVIDSK